VKFFSCRCPCTGPAGKAGYENLHARIFPDQNPNRRKILEQKILREKWQLQ